MDSRPPTLFLTVGLPGAGKTTRARELAGEHSILRLTPDDWMAPLFGHNDAHGRRDILEGRLIWVAHEVIVSGASVVLDFGCWSPEERYAIRAITGWRTPPSSWSTSGSRSRNAELAATAVGCRRARRRPR